jgi:hypothetical protein
VDGYEIGATQVKQLKIFLFWFAAEYALFGLVVANGRAYNQANYAATLVSDMLISVFNFWFAVKFIEGKDNRTWPALLGCVLGGGCGSLSSIAFTKWAYGA